MKFGPKDADRALENRNVEAAHERQRLHGAQAHLERLISGLPQRRLA